jgi:N-methylhydantoinase B/oxoprolinase/acetone carboxylase alpha subunit
LTARSFEAARSARLTKGSGLPLRIPVVEMIEIGAGGGSIGKLDALGRIEVGPQSAGAAPGPACYDQGGDAATVTDADLILGRLDRERFAEGRIRLNQARAEKVLSRDIGGPLGMESHLAAQGVCDMVDEAMANAARVHASEHGKDLRDWTMIAFGGAGPLHAGRLAGKLGIRRLIVPNDPGVGSAVGFLSAPISYETVRSSYMKLSSFDAPKVDSVLNELAAEARRVVRAGAPDGPLQERRGVLMRYLGQGHEIEIALPLGPVAPANAIALKDDFERRYEELYGRALPDNEIEMLTWSVVVSTPPRKSDPAPRPNCEAPAPAPLEIRPVFDAAESVFVDTPTYWRADLSAGQELTGPAMVVEPQTTTIVPAEFRCRVDGEGNLILDRAEGENTRAASAREDPMREQVMWSRLQSIVDEQAGTLMRTAFSPIVRESGDLSAGLFDIDGQMLVQAVTGTPGHVNTMATACKKFFEHFPKQDMRPGDIYLTNDPWLGSGHLNDFVLLKPCFHAGLLIGFSSCTSHLVDIGGHCLGPTGSDIYDEGLYVPPIKLMDEGQLNETFMVLLKANSRMPEQAAGDVRALIACCEVSARRLDDTMAEFAVPDLSPLSDTILKSSRAATGARIKAIPDGIYESVMTVDGYEIPITLKARMIVDGEALQVNFYDCPDLSRFGINVPLNYAEAYTVFGIKCVVAPDVPNNHGSLSPFRVTAPEATLLNAPKPAPVCSRHIVGQLLPDVVMGCLHRALPGRVPAEGASTLWDLPMKGRSRVAASNRDAHFATELVHNGGTGARRNKDGLSATAFPSGVLGSQVEITESTTPILVARREYRCDSAGPGRHRGGLGQIIEVEGRGETDLVLFGTVDRVTYPARGRESGRNGAPGHLRLSTGEVFSGKGACEVPAGTRLFVETPGGGGYGDPFTRTPDEVAKDCTQGMISRKAARDDYGVVLRSDGSVDEVATGRLRTGDGYDGASA